MTYRDWQPHSFFLGYQRRWRRDRSRLKLCEKSRQTGLSLTEAADLVDHKAVKEARVDAWVSSRDELQARLFAQDCLNYASVIDAAARDLGERVFDEEKHAAQVVEFANGRRIHSLSSNPDAQAGKRGDRVLDEFALHKDQRKMWAIAYPGITWGGAMHVISTHRGTGSFFNELVREVREKGNPKKLSLHRVTLQDALDEGLLVKLKGKLPKDDPVQDMDEAAYWNHIKSGCADEESFQQEYCCVPGDDASAFLEWELIVAGEYAGAEAAAWQTDLAACVNPLYVGVDVGRDHDLTVIWVLELAGGRFLTRRVIELASATFERQEFELYRVLDWPAVRRCCIDQTGIGRQFAERAQTRYGSYRVEGITFTGPVKEELAFPVRRALEDRNLRLPESPAIRADLRSVKKETTAAGNIRFSADRGKGGHADRFWGLALAVHAAKQVTTYVPPRALPAATGVEVFAA